ncbi:DUF4332 domain-containing protein [bacterium]|nr:DUF4332 domain-containing protein [bacterium]
MKILLLFFSISLFAAGYHLEDISDILEIKKEMIEIFNKSNIKTTDEYLEKTQTSRMRVDFSKQFKLSLEQVQYWASLCDLMRIKGIGPTTAKLFYQVNIRSISKLKKAEVKDLLPKLEEANKKYKFTPFIPDENQIQSWKERAERLEALLK